MTGFPGFTQVCLGPCVDVMENQCALYSWSVWKDVDLSLSALPAGNHRLPLVRLNFIFLNRSTLG